jgi:hypothetical protein
MISRQPIAGLLLHHRAASFAESLMPTSTAMSFDLIKLSPNLREDRSPLPYLAKCFVLHISCVELLTVKMRAGINIAMAALRRGAMNLWLRGHCVRTIAHFPTRASGELDLRSPHPGRTSSAAIREDDRDFVR